MTGKDSRTRLLEDGWTDGYSTLYARESGVRPCFAYRIRLSIVEDIGNNLSDDAHTKNNE